MNKFTEMLREADVDGDLQAQFAARLSQVAQSRRVRVQDVVRALIGNIVGVCKAAGTGPEDWPDAAKAVCDEVKRQFQVPSKRILDMH